MSGQIRSAEHKTMHCIAGGACSQFAALCNTCAVVVRLIPSRSFARWAEFRVAGGHHAGDACVPAVPSVPGVWTQLLFTLA